MANRRDRHETWERTPLNGVQLYDVATGQQIRRKFLRREASRSIVLSRLARTRRTSFVSCAML